MSQEQLGFDQGDQPSAVQASFQARVEEVDGDMTELVSAVTDPVDALSLVYGYTDVLVETADVSPAQAHRLAVAWVSQRLCDACAGDSTLLGEKRELWDPVFDAVKLKGDMNSPATWERTREAVRLFDQADESFLRGY